MSSSLIGYLIRIQRASLLPEGHSLPWRLRFQPRIHRRGRQLPLLSGFTLLMSLAVYLTYNLTFVQHQGRYLFSALVPIAIGVAVAWALLIRPLTDRYPAAGYLLPLGLGLLLVGLDLLALYRFIVPALTPG